MVVEGGGGQKSCVRMPRLAAGVGRTRPTDILEISVVRKHPQVIEITSEYNPTLFLSPRRRITRTNTLRKVWGYDPPWPRHRMSVHPILP